MIVLQEKESYICLGQKLQMPLAIVSSILQTVRQLVNYSVKEILCAE